MQHCTQLSNETSYHQRLREYGLFIEYQKLRNHIPSGVYVAPSLVDIRLWYGVIFIRTGMYRRGIFKFVIRIPELYPEKGPDIFFQSCVFHPLVHPNTGRVDLSSRFAVWKPSRDYIVLTTVFLKSIFYKPESWQCLHAYHPEALALWRTNNAEFCRRAEHCVRQSIDRVYVNVDADKCSLQFTRPIPEHDRVRRNIQAGKKDYDNWFD